MTLQAPARAQPTILVRISGSRMMPLIPGHSLVRCRPAHAADVQVGDIVVCRTDERFSAHRVLDRHETSGQVVFLIQGDHEPAAQSIEAGEVVGVATNLITEGSFRLLNPDPRDRRIRILTALKRVGWRAAAPVRWLVQPILLSAYPRCSHPPSPAEHALLLALMDDAPPAAAPAAPFDWTRFLELALLHSMAPAAARLAAIAPPEVAAFLDLAHRRAILLHRRAALAASEIHRAFTAAGIASVVLKGPHLFEAYYADAFPRPYGDLDIAVAPRDLAPALRVLTQLGYRETEGRLAGALLRAVHFHLALEHSATDRPRLELHWSLVDRANLYRAPVEEVLARSVLLTAGDLSFHAPCREDLFVYLCMHITKHALLNGAGLRTGQPAAWFIESRTGNRLLWFVDLHRIIAREGAALDWQQVRQRARDWNATADVEECLDVLRVLHPAGTDNLPPPARPPAPPGLTDRLLARGVRGGLWGRLLEMNPVLIFRPARLALLGRLLFPSRPELAAFHRTESALRLAALRVVHPLLFALRLLRPPTH